MFEDPLAKVLAELEENYKVLQAEAEKLKGSDLYQLACNSLQRSEDLIREIKKEL